MKRPKKPRCPSGFAFANLAFERKCLACDEKPIHAAIRGGGAGHGCSFLRDGWLLCRACTIVYDLEHRGHTRIAPPRGLDLDSALWVLRHREVLYLAR